jgi:hypothetical protein
MKILLKKVPLEDAQDYAKANQYIQKFLRDVRSK